MIRVSPGIHLREDELEVSFTRARGPGGQNVNKVETAVVLRFDARRSSSLPESVRRRAIGLAGKKADSFGVITVRARRHRTQQANRRLAVEMLVDLISRAAVKPKDRHATAPSAAARRRRLESKKRRSRVKRLRRGPSAIDE